jgi:hypothetical protein
MGFYNISTFPFLTIHECSTSKTVNTSIVKEVFQCQIKKINVIKQSQKDWKGKLNGG